MVDLNFSRLEAYTFNYASLLFTKATIMISSISLFHPKLKTNDEINANAFSHSTATKMDCHE